MPCRGAKKRRSGRAGRRIHFRSPKTQQTVQGGDTKEVREGRSEIQQLRREVRKLSSGRMEEGTEDEATDSHQVSPSPSPPELLPQQPLPPADFEHPPLERGASEGVLAALGIGVASQSAEADEEFGDHLVDAMEWLGRMKQEG